MLQKSAPLHSSSFSRHLVWQSTKEVPSKTPVSDKNGIFVTTRVPYSTISYSGNPIIVSGTVDLQFAETTGRKLRSNIDTMHTGAGNDRDLQASNMQAASFDLQITHQIPSSPRSPSPPPSTYRGARGG